MLHLSLGIFLLPLLPLPLTPQAGGSPGIPGGVFENERLHLRIRPPAGWRLVNAGARQDEAVEFWKEDEYGPRIQITTIPFPISNADDLEEVQGQLRQALLQKFPDLRIDHESTLTHDGQPALEVMATLPAGDTYYHVLQRCLFARDHIYIITCASFESSFLSDLPAFRASIDSLEIVEGGGWSRLATTGKTPLITAQTMAIMGLGFVGFGFLLRRFTVNRLTRMGRWPPADRE